MVMPSRTQMSAFCKGSSSLVTSTPPLAGYFKEIKRVASCFSKRPVGAFVRWSKCLSCIFNQNQIVLFYHRNNAVHVGVDHTCAPGHTPFVFGVSAFSIPSALRQRVSSTSAIQVSAPTHSTASTLGYEGKGGGNLPHRRHQYHWLQEPWQ